MHPDILFQKLQAIESRLDLVLDSLSLSHQKETYIMTTIAEIKDAIAAEAAEVKARVDALEAEVQALKDSVTNGVAVTEAELADLLTSVQGIFTPAAV